MEIKNQEQVLKLQDEFKTRLLESVDSLRKGKPPSLPTMVKDREELIVRTQARLDDAMKEREAVLGHWDDRIARLKADVERFGAETQEIKQRVVEEKPVAPKVDLPKEVGRKAKPKR